MSTAVILAGGGGKRLWPLSTTKEPKFLLKIGEYSLLGQTILRLQKSKLFDNIVVCSGEKYRDIVDKEVKNYYGVKTIFEPSARDSMPAIILSTHYVQNILKDEKVAFFPADHIINDQEIFFQSLKIALCQSDDNKLITIGINPSEPSSAFGYINSGDEINENVAKVVKFVEKPTKEKAQVFINKGNYLWNSGLFFAKTNFILDNFAKIYELDISNIFDTKNNINIDIWEKIEKISFDFGFVEKISENDLIEVVKSNFSWIDIGDFNTLENYLNDSNMKIIGSSLIIEVDSNNNFIYNTTADIVALCGINNCIVIKTDKRLLICNKDSSQEIKQIVLNLENENPKYL